MKCLITNREARAFRSRGFSLIEILVVVVIVGVLMAVALPSYENSMQKGRRADARAAILDVANRQESFMLDNNTYTTDLTDLGFATSPHISEEQHYSVAVAACTAGDIGRCYTITASARAGSPQAKDGCGSLIMDSDGEKRISGYGEDCW